jgi:serine/threonine protein kinase
VDGHDLAAVMKSYPDGAPNAFTGQTGQQIAEGLSYLHANGILHLNLSPGNVIYNSGRTSLKLRDYGLRTFKLANFAKARCIDSTFSFFC